MITFALICVEDLASWPPLLRLVYKSVDVKHAAFRSDGDDHIVYAHDSTPFMLRHESYL